MIEGKVETNIRYSVRTKFGMWNVTQRRELQQFAAVKWSTMGLQMLGHSGTQWRRQVGDNTYLPMCDALMALMHHSCLASAASHVTCTTF